MAKVHLFLLLTIVGEKILNGKYILVKINEKGNDSKIIQKQILS